MSSIPSASSPAPLGISQEDWDDVDSPELSDDELAQLRPASEMPAEIYAQLPRRGRGRPKSENAKVNVTLRLDPRLVEAYKALGDGWQVRMQEVLARGIEPARPAPQPRAVALIGPSGKITQHSLGFHDVNLDGMETFKVNMKPGCAFEAIKVGSLNVLYAKRVRHWNKDYFDLAIPIKKGAQPKRPKRTDAKKGTSRFSG